ncbi:hypothetical protein CTEN210_09879 [Chaetoceros tenuissimus]|uniref:Aminotransferase class V domain-containing protein n=1 Tax=Chaetoceros tenuissimus TaxID=426638 RepID=A0AAD3H813_9STRA|nr:hypothetical protein CTEN210_09879 [Chaetoceros tenuissimus]
MDTQTGQMYFWNNAGASPSPQVVLDVMNNHLQLETLEGGYRAESLARKDVENVYHSVAKLVNAPSFEDIALVESATVAWNRAFYSMANYILDESIKEAKHREANGDFNEPLTRIILISEAEYAANVVAICKYCADQNFRTGDLVQWRLFVLPSKIITQEKDEGSINAGIVDVDVLERLLSMEESSETLEVLRNHCIKEISLNSFSAQEDKSFRVKDVAMVCVTHIPTNSGIINPVNTIGNTISKFNEKRNLSPPILFLVDACQSVGQMKVDVQAMHAHALSATGRKYLRGPRGTGFLYISSCISERLTPNEVDHCAAPIVKMNKTENNYNLNIAYKSKAKRFEYWEKSISSKLGLGAAIEFSINDIGISNAEKKITALGSLLRKELRNVHGVSIYHDVENYSPLCAIVCFSLNGFHPEEILDYMVKEASHCGRFELSIVPKTSTPFDSMNTETENLIRASLSYFNEEQEIREFVSKLKAMIKQLSHS